MERIVLERSGARRIAFEGRVLADVSGKREGLVKWTELRIYKTDTGRYLLARDRKSTLPGEEDIFEATACDTPDDLIRLLHDDKGRLGRLSKEALDLASKADPAISSVEELDDARRPDRVSTIGDEGAAHDDDEVEETDEDLARALQHISRCLLIGGIPPDGFFHTLEAASVRLAQRSGAETGDASASALAQTVTRLWEVNERLDADLRAARAKIARLEAIDRERDA